MSPLPLILSLCLQAGIIIGACSLAGRLATKLGQPSVVGMMIAGVLLGPSMLGAFWPAEQSWVFPVATLDWLKVVGALGVGGYIFCVGLDFDLAKVRERGALTVAVASAGVVVPFLLAVPLAISTQHVPDWFSPAASLGQQVLFLGAALSITAFPMLVWIVRSKGLAAGCHFRRGHRRRLCMGHPCNRPCLIRWHFRPHFSLPLRHYSYDRRRKVRRATATCRSRGGMRKTSKPDWVGDICCDRAIPRFYHLQQLVWYACGLRRVSLRVGDTQRRTESPTPID